MKDVRKRNNDAGAHTSGLAYKGKLSKSEVGRANPFAVASRYEATQDYVQLAESINNKRVEKVADEERVHIKKFLRLLYELAPDEEKLYAKRAKEVEGEIKKKYRTTRNTAHSQYSANGFGRLTQLKLNLFYITYLD